MAVFLGSRGQGCAKKEEEEKEQLRTAGQELGQMQSGSADGHARAKILAIDLSGDAKMRSKIKRERERESGASLARIDAR